MHGNEHIDWRLAELAESQGGQVCRKQLVAAGVTRAQMEERLASGHLVRIVRGVYGVGHRPTRLLDHWWTPLLLAWPSAGLAGAAAAYAYGILEHPPDRVDVTVPRRTAPKDRPGRRFHRRPGVAIVEHDGWPVPTPAQVLLDLAMWRSPHVVRRAVERAGQLELDVRGLDELLDGRPGSAALRRFVGRPLGRTRSLAESRALVMLEDAGLPAPVPNADVGGDEVDLLWPELGLAVELDLHPRHRTPAGRAADAAKTARLEARGLRVLRFDELTDDLVQAVSHAREGVPFRPWPPPRSATSA